VANDFWLAGIQTSWNAFWPVLKANKMRLPCRDHETNTKTKQPSGTKRRTRATMLSHKTESLHQSGIPSTKHPVIADDRRVKADSESDRPGVSKMATKGERVHGAEHDSTSGALAV
jgi:hypothetical protein